MLELLSVFSPPWARLSPCVLLVCALLVLGCFVGVDWEDWGMSGCVLELRRVLMGVLRV